MECCVAGLLFGEISRDVADDQAVIETFAPRLLMLDPSYAKRSPLTLQRSVQIERLGGLGILVHDGVDGGDHGLGRVGLEYVAAHVDARRALVDGFVGHRERVELRELLAAGDHDRHRAGGGDGIFDSVSLSVRQASDIPSATAIEQIKSGAFGILEASSATAESLGIKPGSKRVIVRNVIDERAPKLGIIWEKAQELPVYELPSDARVFVKERWTGAPLMAGFRRGTGAVLWIATKPGERGYERFPYVLHA